MREGQSVDRSSNMFSIGKREVMKLSLDVLFCSHANIPSSSIDMMVSVTDPLLYHHSYHTSEASSDGRY